MAKLCESLPDYVKDVVVVRQQWALALNRTKNPADREKAKRILEDLMKKHGSDPETLGILGRIYKDQYREEKDKEGYKAKSALDEAIRVYTKGFESDPRDYYPGVNALTLLYVKGDEESLKEMKRMIPLVNFAVARRGGAASEDYWDLATVLELACLDNNWKTAKFVLPKAQFMAKASWMTRTTMENLKLLRDAGTRRRQIYPELDEIIEILMRQVVEMEGPN
jgi:tetratricopeptide (TPR) repeat protein